MAAPKRDGRHDRRRAGFEFGGQLGRREAVECTPGRSCCRRPGTAASRRAARGGRRARRCPVGPSILWPLKARKSAPQRCTSSRQMRHALGGIDQHDGAGRVGPAGDFGDRVDRAEHVRHRGDGDDLGALGEQRSSSSSFNRPSSVIGMWRRTAPGPLGQLLPRHEVRVVLHRGEQDFVAGLHVRVAPTAGHEVDAGRRAGGEDDFLACRRVDERADFLAGLFVLLGASAR